MMRQGRADGLTYQDCLKYFYRPGDWANLSERKKIEVFQAIANEVADREDWPNMEVVSGDCGNKPGEEKVISGQYIQDTLCNGEIWRRIVKDPKVLQKKPLNFREDVENLCHERKHGDQFLEIDRLNSQGTYGYQFLSNYWLTSHSNVEEVEAWRLNSENYISSEINYDEYYKQILEVDARDYAKKMVEQLEGEAFIKFQREYDKKISEGKEENLHFSKIGDRSQVEGLIVREKIDSLKGYYKKIFEERKKEDHFFNYADPCKGVYWKAKDDMSSLYHFFISEHRRILGQAPSDVFKKEIEEYNIKHLQTMDVLAEVYLNTPEDFPSDKQKRSVIIEYLDESYKLITMHLDELEKQLVNEISEKDSLANRSSLSRTSLSEYCQPINSQATKVSLAKSSAKEESKEAIKAANEEYIR